MKLIELDSHPLIDTFRQCASEFSNKEGEIYHLLLPPEYNLTEEDTINPLFFFFVENTSERDIYKQFGEGNYVLHLEGNKLIPIKGFDHNFSIEIFQTTPCTTTKGFSFDMHEVNCNPFQPSPIPPLCDEIQNAYENPQDALTFLRSRIRSPKLPAVLNKLEEKAKKAEYSIQNRDNIVMEIHDLMDEISDIVFEVVPFHYIPTIFKMKTNFIIFYAVSNAFHSKLLQVFHNSYHLENIKAQKAIHSGMNSIANPKGLNEAASYIRNLQLMSSAASGISMVTNFFNTVIKSIPDANAAADDILPAVCDGISRCPSLSSHIVSTFQYLADIWPMEGLDERTTYIIVTCSIAASHFGNGPDEKKELPQMKTYTIEVKEDQTIEMLQDLLSSI